MRILIAEDDLTSMSMLVAVLQKAGHEVVEAADGAQAWEVLHKTGAPQLAILDWSMPEMDGLEVVRRVRMLETDCPPYIIMLTTRDQKTDIVTGLEAGADDYLAKPFDIGELRARVNAGRRMILLQNELREKEKLQGVLEMAGAVCHELNQPLQSVLSLTELLMMEVDPREPNFKKIRTIKEGVDRIAELTRKIRRTAQYRSKPYLSGRIIDIEGASQGENNHGNERKSDTGRG